MPLGSAAPASMRRHGINWSSEHVVPRLGTRSSGAIGPRIGGRLRFGTQKGGAALFFTPTTAWEFIASRLEAGEEVEVINLRMPRGSKGYVMKIDLGLGLPKLYVKLQLVSKKVIGRSFHYSE